MAMMVLHLGHAWFVGTARGEGSQAHESMGMARTDVSEILPYSNSKIASTSTAIPAGSETAPTALRAATP